MGMDRSKQKMDLKRLIQSYALAHLDLNIELSIDQELWRFPPVIPES